MAIVRWTPGSFGFRSPFSELERLRGQMMNVLENFPNWVEGRLTPKTGVFPLFNLSQDEDNLYLTAELAGVAPGDLELSVENDNLILRGERKIPEADKKVNYHRREREAGFFRRVISLPAKVDVEKVKAVTKNGVLEVVLPLAAEAKPRQVAIAAE